MIRNALTGLLVLLSTAPCLAQPGSTNPQSSTPLRIRAPEPRIVYIVRPESTIFPSLLIASATMDMNRGIPQPDTQLGEPGGFLGVGIVSPSNRTPVSVTITCDDLLEPSTYKGEIARAGEVYCIMPKIKWKFRELAKCRQQLPANIVFKVKLGTRDEVEHTETCMVRTINECPLVFIHEGGAPISMHFIAAAYVNENHPWVDGLLKDALDTHVVPSFFGYQKRDSDAVLQQVYAIWRTLKARGISYSDVSVPIVKDDKVLSQTIRFLDECIVNKQANCIDGTVMFASVLQRIGIHTKIVCVPGHAFLAIDLNSDGTGDIGLETTILGSSRKDTYVLLDKLRPIIKKQADYDEPSWACFEAAVKVGTKRLIDEYPKIMHQVEAPLDYRLISIAEARDLGVRPIPYAELVGPTTTKTPTAPQNPPRHLIPVR